MQRVSIGSSSGTDSSRQGYGHPVGAGIMLGMMNKGMVSAQISHSRTQRVARMGVRVASIMACPRGKEAIRESVQGAAIMLSTALCLSHPALPSAEAAAAGQKDLSAAASMQRPLTVSEASHHSPSGSEGIYLGGSLASCSATASCVSTSALNAPQSYMPPWLFSPMKQSLAHR